MAIRVHILAKEINVNSKAILDKCKAEGLDNVVKNHMTVLTAGLEATIREWFSEGDHATTEETSERVNLEKVRPSRRRKKAASEESALTSDQMAEEGLEETEESFMEEEEHVLAEEETVPTTAELPSELEEEKVASHPIAPAAEPEEKVEPAVQEQKDAAHPTVEKPHHDKSILIPAAKVELPQGKPSHDISAEKEGHKPSRVDKHHKEHHEKPKPEPVKPIGPMNVPAPAVLRGPRVVRVEKPDVIARPVPREQIARTTEPDFSVPIAGGNKTGRKIKTQQDIDEEAAKAKKAKARINPRRGKVTESIEQLKEWRDRDLIERSQRLAQASDHPTVVRKAESKKHKSVAPHAKHGKIQIEEPIILKEFCSATGIPFSKLFPKLMEQGIPATINQSITSEQAEFLSLEFGVEIEVIKPKSHYDELVEQFIKRQSPKLQRRSPVVTLLGHVDHGKTSLLDRIRNERVAAGEAGGITQHIGAYRYPIKDRHVVFLDTPGHEAFTALRARGAQMTDIVILVVAANDGVMPQTVEAISHAKAANVPIVVALNKIDLPNVDQHKVLGQLAEHGLIPTEWGGETDIIRTSAVTGQGMDELVEHLNTLADLLDLSADFSGPATGLVIESRQDPSKGTVCDFMVQEGTLKISDVLVAGVSCGRVRAMLDDTGKVITSAGPATPVEILGLDKVPESGDRFYVVSNLALAQEIAEEKRQEDRSLYLKSKPKVTLENIFQQVETGQVHHLNLIVKADTQGSMEVLKAKLSDMGSSEVKVRILHTAVGAITEGDVILAEASEAIILGFGVVADDLARNRAVDLDVEIRTYTVIYHLLEDINSALEGMLTPTIEQKTTGRATVREVFRITKVGSVAGCIVTEGTIERSSKIRIIRQNVIVRDEATLESLKRFKDDVREVRQGFECGIKVNGFDDIKGGDIIEAYQVLEVARKLQSAESGGSKK